MSLLAYRVKAGVLAAALAAVLTIAPALVQAQSGSGKPAKSAGSAQIERGRYLVKIAGCNDCHTPNYAMSGGKVAEKEWLTGDTLGWRGPWGTTYPANLRLYMQRMNEDKWVQTAKSLKTRPPMPWFALHDMTTSDLRAMYRYVRSLGPAGQEAPAYVPPDKEPKPPFVQFPAPPK